MPFQIIPVTGLTPQKTFELLAYLTKTFNDSVTARTTQIDSNYGRWMDNYNAKPAQAVRSTPWVGASNFVPQLTRIHTDILAARIYGILTGTKPFWRPSTFNQDYKSSMMSAVAEYMDMKSNYDINLFSRLDEIILETLKAGTTTLKARWQEEEEWTVASTEQKTPITYGNLELDVVPFYDFFPYPLTAPTIDKTLVRHSRIRLSKEEVEYRVAKGMWTRAAANMLLNGGSPPNQQEVDAAQASGISLQRDNTRPFEVVESSLKYPLEDGKNLRIVAVFNPKVAGELGMLRLYHSYFSDPKLDMYVDFRFIPRSNSYYGISIPEILEGAQEEQAQIHNARRDASTIVNMPTFKKKRYSFNNFTAASEWYPGKTFEVDDMNDVAPMQLGVTYSPMMEEENMVLQLAERATGVTQPSQGMGTGTMGKKGTYNTGGTLALLTEGNRRLDIYIKRLKQPLHRLGKIIFISYRDFGDPEELKQWGENGQLIQEAFSIPVTDPKYKNLLLDFSASDAGANRETDRQSLLLMSNTAASYYQQIMGLAQMAAGMPEGSPAKNVVMAVIDSAHDLFTRVLTAFNIDGRKQLVPDVRALLTGGSAQGPAPNGTPQPQQPGPAQGDVPDPRLSVVSRLAAGPIGQGSALPTQ